MEFRYISFHVNASSESPADTCGQTGDVTKFTDMCETANTRLKIEGEEQEIFNVCSERYYITGERESDWHSHIQGVPGGTCQTSGGCSLC